MNKEYIKYYELLNTSNSIQRLKNLKELYEQEKKSISIERNRKKINNHIHTIYSFSPFSPSLALWIAALSGLQIAGLMDHDSLAGAGEFSEGGKILNIATTIGLECRVNFSGTKIEGRRINNPDQVNNAYVAIHGIPEKMIDKIDNYFKPVRKARKQRSRRMVEKLNSIIRRYSLHLDFEKEVYGLSLYDQGGTITERHILFALAQKIIIKYPDKMKLIDFLKKDLGLHISLKNQNFLMEPHNPFYAYDILNVLKGHMAGHFYIDAKEECPNVREIIECAKETGSILAYSYLGDVAESVTGDKKNQKFEDDYLDSLFDVLAELGFKAVTYMPTRNSHEQLQRVRALCDKHQFFQISGEDINSPRQSFVYDMKVFTHEYNNLIENAWALIGHEKNVNSDYHRGFFSENIMAAYPQLRQRIEIYKEIGERAYGISNENKSS